jgi:hypothetical protein
MPKPQKPKNYPVTPDGRYFVVRGRLWRCTNPRLSAQDKQRLTRELMQARRQVRAAKDDPDALHAARLSVDAAKVALGERGAPWWGGSEPTYDRRMAENTPYRAWYLALPSDAPDGNA